MKNKIYKNKDVLKTKKFYSRICGSSYKFEIVYVNEKGIKISKSFQYRKLASSYKDNLFLKVKKFIIENTPDSDLPLSRRAYRASTKLKKISIVIDTQKFNVDQITNSAITIGKFIEYDELLESNDDFIVGMRRFVLNNITDNPPVVKKRHGYGGFFTTPYLFDSMGDHMFFTELGSQRPVISERELERNRKIHKDENEKDKKNREKMEKLDKEITSKKKTHTRELARFR